VKVISRLAANSNSNGNRSGNPNKRRRKRPTKFNLNAQRRGEIIRHAKHVRPEDLSRWLIAWIWHCPNADEWSLMNCAQYRLGRTITRADAIELLDRALGERPKRRADKLGKYLGLSYATRQELQIRTIGANDVTKRTRKLLRKRKDRAAKAAKRLANGAQPHRESLSRTKPWEAEGMSRRTWERRQLKMPRDANSSAILFSYLKDESASAEASQEGQQEDFRGGLRPLKEVEEKRRPSSQTATMVAADEAASVGVRVRVFEVLSLSGVERLGINYG
jgi:hypothetical protein